MTDLKTFKMSEGEYRSASRNDEGRCLVCGSEAFGVEQDARNYECETCESEQVFGIEELLVMGKIEII